jgi:hypothetical protein
VHTDVRFGDYAQKRTMLWPPRKDRANLRCAQRCFAARAVDRARRAGYGIRSLSKESR